MAVTHETEQGNVMQHVRSGFGEEDIEMPRADLEERVGEAGPGVEVNFGISTSFLETGKALAARFKLNKRQTIALLIICRQLDLIQCSAKSEVSQLCQFVGGEGGTGKSRVIETLVELFACKKISNRLLITATSGTAASRINGITIHSACGFSKDQATGTSMAKDLDGVRLAKITERFIHGQTRMNWQEKDLLVIDEPGSKPVMGVDDLLLGLTQHWCRDRSVFPTEDDRLDLATIMLFQSYTACRPAELVDGTKCRGGQDPLFEDLEHDDAATGMAVKRSLPISQDITQSVEEHNAVSGAGHKQEESEQEHDLDSDNSVLDTDDPYDSDGAEDTQSDDEDSNNTTNQGGQRTFWRWKSCSDTTKELRISPSRMHHLFISRKPVADSMSQAQPGFTGNPDKTDLDLLNARCYREDKRIPWETGITVVTPLNRNRWNLNMEAALSLQVQQRSMMRIFLSQHKWKNGPPTEEEATMMLNQGDDSAIPVPGVFMFVPGMPVVVNRNTHQGLKLVNGASYTGLEVILDKAYPGYRISADTMIHFGPPAGIILESETTKDVHFVGMPPGTMLLTPMSVMIRRQRSRPWQQKDVSRKGLPCAAAFACTDYKVQGRTLERVAIELRGTRTTTYSTYAFYLDRIGTDLGSEEKWTSYCFRRGHANALLGIAPDSIVDQVMRHDPLTGCLQNAYQNSRVGFNTQDAFLERDPSADGLTRAFTHMSIKCNPEVPKQIPKAELAKLPPDPEVVRLAKQVEAMARRMRQDYGFIKAAPERVREEYQQLRKDLRSTEKAFRDDMTKVYQEECRRRLHNEELQRQLSEMTVDPELDERAKPEPSVQHQLEERTKLQAILSDFRQDLDAKATTDRKVRAVELMVLLASCREVRRPTVSTSSSLCQGSIRPGSPDIKPAVPNVKVEEIPVVLGETQCIYCVGEEQLPYSRRMRSFGRKSHMWDHVENLHLKYERKDGPFTCPHPHWVRFRTSAAGQAVVVGEEFIDSLPLYVEPQA
ncbi:hypothetical protein H634G_11327 [Metarhizium anisopliae BRIP 53293]|uniref:ATP-dependent DNA helicase n=2 Tax=Metarhizium anisopliae BRIP 53293 TaxID=1291518 RepID=A0A0D9NLE6_METAN|nr:hypothetical protein H634G_11327 [Metarhizium anisopliae BRIP 53293]